MFCPLASVLQQKRNKFTNQKIKKSILYEKAKLSSSRSKSSRQLNHHNIFRSCYYRPGTDLGCLITILRYFFGKRRSSFLTVHILRNDHLLFRGNYFLYTSRLLLTYSLNFICRGTGCTPCLQFCSFSKTPGK